MRSWPARATTTSACSPSGRLLPRARPTCADPATTRGAPVASAEFACDAAAVRAARRFVIDEARPTGLDAELVALLVSELAANAVLHARTPFTVAVDNDDSVVRVAVTDGRSTPPVMKAHSP